MSVVMLSINSDRWEAARVEALSEAGFSQVSLGGSHFSAVYDGERVEGILEPFENTDLKYQVVIIPPIEED